MKRGTNFNDEETASLLVKFSNEIKSENNRNLMKQGTFDC
jgi:hypothetical protein